MFTQGDLIFLKKKKVLSEFQVIHIIMSPALTHLQMNYLKQKSCQKYS